MNYKLIPIFLAVIIGLLFLSNNASALPQETCIVALDGCESEMLVDTPRFCHYEVDYNAFTADYKRINIRVDQGGMFNGDRDQSYVFDSTSESRYFTVWVDKHTQPTYITCSGIDSSGLLHALDQAVLGTAEPYLVNDPQYTTLSSDDNPTIFWMGMGFILISLISMFFLAMDIRRKN